MWSVGCVFAELYKKKPLFRGDSEIGQLHQVFMALGTPNDEMWENCNSLPNFNPEFPKWTEDFNKYIPINMGEESKDLLRKMIVLDPIKRISAKDAISHPFFKDIKSLFPEIMIHE